MRELLITNPICFLVGIAVGLYLYGRGWRIVRRKDADEG